MNRILFLLVSIILTGAWLTLAPERAPAQQEPPSAFDFLPAIQKIAVRAYPSDPCNILGSIIRTPGAPKPRATSKLCGEPAQH